jgi:hypothetical protein
MPVALFFTSNKYPACLIRGFFSCTIFYNRCISFI